MKMKNAEVIPHEMTDIDVWEYDGNPSNYRRHDKGQTALLDANIREVGFATAVVVNKRTKHIIDGHLRIQEARASGIDKVPALVLDIDEEHELKILSTLDYINRKGSSFQDKFVDLLEKVKFDDALLQQEFSRAVEIADQSIPEADGTLMKKNCYYILMVFNDQMVYETARTQFNAGVVKTSKGKVLKTCIVDGDELFKTL